ncbi:MAG: SDR family NAD(P)-dependent oxidoreductase [Pyrinomonadaceae bacterium]
MDKDRITSGLKDKVAIVTGGGNGIGRGIAFVLARRGVKVAVADIDERRARETAEQLRGIGGDAIGLAVDVSVVTEVTRLMEDVKSAYGRIDILVNNAGIVSNTHTTEVREEQWHRMLSVNLSGVFFCSQAAARVMIPHGSGRIINIASTAAHVASRGYAAYCASKGGVVAMTRAMAVDLAEHGILVNSVSPGSMDTDLTEQMRRLNPEGFARRANRVPVRRAASVEDIAHAVAFFAGEESSFITGRDILVDGGMLAQHPGYVA